MRGGKEPQGKGKELPLGEVKNPPCWEEIKNSRGRGDKELTRMGGDKELRGRGR